LRLVYAGWDDIKVILLGTSPLAEADSGPFMTNGPDPLWVIYGTPRNPWLCQARRVGEARTPMALGRTPLPTAHDRLLAQDTEPWAQPTRCRRPQGSHNSPVVERWLRSIPWQGDLPRGNIPTVKGALSVHWKLDDRPISMKRYEFAAIDGPEKTSAPEMH